jgi:hypothetical protein
MQLIANVAIKLGWKRRRVDCVVYSDNFGSWDGRVIK